MTAPTAVKILNVDDDQGGRYSTTRVLRKAGFHVVEAATGAQALSMVAAEDPYLVLLDVNLPDISGLEVCRRIKADAATAHIPVVQMSATYVEVSDRTRGLETGADGYLVEPVEPSELIATVNAFIRMRRAEDAALADAREWQSIFDAVTDGVALLDLYGKVLRANASFARLVGGTDIALSGTRWTALPVCSEAPQFCAVVDGRLGSGKREITEIVLGERTFQVTLDPVCGQSGVSAAVCILSDITDRIKAAEERARLLAAEQVARREAEDANRLKDEFLAKVSHELRTPLNSVLGWAALLRSGRLDASASERALETIERNARLQSKLIDDLLDASRIVSGRLRIELVPMDLTPVISSAMEAVLPLAAGKNIEVRSLLETDTAGIMGDSQRLQQVMSNLLSNSVKFTPEGGEIVVTMQKLDEEVQITVTDTGVGIRPDFLPHVFDCFRQQDSTSTRSHGGLGLGLAIVKNLVELHNGAVCADSAGEGKGTGITVILPLINHHEETTRRPELPGVEEHADIRGVRVLVVDDEPDTRELICTALVRYGAEVRPAASAQEARESLTSFVPDVILSDIEMPREDGYELIASIRRLEGRQSRRIPAVALTAHASTDDRDRALLAGFRAHLSKPVEPMKLVSMIARLASRAAHSTAPRPCS